MKVHISTLIPQELELIAILDPGINHKNQSLGSPQITSSHAPKKGNQFRDRDGGDDYEIYCRSPYRLELN